MAAPRDFSDQRFFSRHEIGEPCELTYRGTSLACSVINVSLGGALVKTDKLPPVGETIVFSMPHMGSIQGTVVRCGSGGAAIRFDPDRAKAVGVSDMITFALNRDLLDGAVD